MLLHTVSYQFVRTPPFWSTVELPCQHWLELQQASWDLQDYLDLSSTSCQHLFSLWVVAQWTDNLYIADAFGGSDGGCCRHPSSAKCFVKVKGPGWLCVSLQVNSWHLLMLCLWMYDQLGFLCHFMGNPLSSTSSSWVQEFYPFNEHQHVWA